MTFEVSEKQAYGIILWFGFSTFILGLSCGMAIVNISNTMLGMV